MSDSNMNLSMAIAFLIYFWFLQRRILGFRIVDQDICYRNGCCWTFLALRLFDTWRGLWLYRFLCFGIFFIFHLCLPCKVSKSWSWWFWWLWRVDHCLELNVAYFTITILISKGEHILNVFFAHLK